MNENEPSVLMRRLTSVATSNNRQRKPSSGFLLLDDTNKEQMLVGRRGRKTSELEPLTTAGSATDNDDTSLSDVASIISNGEEADGDFVYTSRAPTPDVETALTAASAMKTRVQEDEADQFEKLRHVQRNTSRIRSSRVKKKQEEAENEVEDDEEDSIIAPVVRHASLPLGSAAAAAAIDTNPGTPLPVFFKKGSTLSRASSFSSTVSRTSSSTNSHQRRRRGRRFSNRGSGMSLGSPPVRRLNARSTFFDLFQAAVVGIMSGLSVALFKLSIEAVRKVAYQQDVLASHHHWFYAFIPAIGGSVVGLLLWIGKSSSFPPGLRGTVEEVDQEASAMVSHSSSANASSSNNNDNKNVENDDNTWMTPQIKRQLAMVRKSIAAVFTLGTGCSLGPEGPCVEIGMSIARACMDLQPRHSSQDKRANWNLLLLSCGAAAGVAAGFNAPIAGVFFALEVVQTAWVSIRSEQQQQLEQHNSDDDDENELDNETRSSSTSAGVASAGSGGGGGGWMSSNSTLTPVLLSSILSALTARALLGNHLILVLTEYSLKTPLIELPLYLLLGAVSGIIAFMFSQMAKLSNAFFAGEVGPTVRAKSAMKALPAPIKPIIGGLLCGVVGLVFPQILFFGYETLNALLANNSLDASVVISLLGVKMAMTAISAGSGLVGGTFAPSLFFGAMTGAAFHNIMTNVLLYFTTQFLGSVTTANGVSLELADIPAYAMVGAASVLAALFRAPLTASLLLFELTRDYDVILPLMASAGVASLIGDVLDEKLVQSQLHLRPRDQDRVSWGDLADRTTTGTTEEEVTTVLP